jgi:nitrate/nitrite transporter NarK
VSNPVLAYVLLAIGTGATLAASPLFWTIAGSFMTGAAAAFCIAFVNTVAQFGGLIGPWLIGLVKDATGSYTIALISLAAFLLLAAGIAIAMPGPKVPDRASPLRARSPDPEPALNSAPENRA